VEKGLRRRDTVVLRLVLFLGWLGLFPAALFTLETRNNQPHTQKPSPVAAVLTEEVEAILLAVQAASTTVAANTQVVTAYAMTLLARFGAFAMWRGLRLP
jgi:hypothetical protein